MSRIVTGVFGVFFVGLAVAILLLGGEASSIGAVIAALVIGFLGGEAIVSAFRDKPSLLSRIGPLP